MITNIKEIAREVREHKRDKGTKWEDILELGIQEDIKSRRIVESFRHACFVPRGRQVYP